MARYIDAEALNLYDNLFMSEDTINKSGVYVRYRAVENLIKNAPTADVQEVKHGTYINTNHGGIHGDYIYRCSCCGNEREAYIEEENYCPHCGAKMDERGDEK